MSFINGRFSMSRYRCLKQPEKLTLAELNKSFNKYKLPTSQALREQPVCFGWIPPLGYDGQDQDYWDLSHCQVQDSLVLRLRILRRKVPQSYLQLIYSERLEQAQQAATQSLDRAARDALLEATKAELLQKALPEVKHIDVVWQLLRQEVQVHSTAKRDLEVFEHLFNRSFAKPMGFYLIPMVPPFLGAFGEDLAQQPDYEAEAQAGLFEAKPTVFFTVQ